MQRKLLNKAIEHIALKKRKNKGSENMKNIIY